VLCRFTGVLSSLSLLGSVTQVDGCRVARQQMNCLEAEIAAASGLRNYENGNPKNRNERDIAQIYTLTQT
jgi:hypothetical protein